MKRLDLKPRYGRLTILRRVGLKVLCRCDCGTEKFFDPSNIAKGKSRSCGCLRKENSRRLGKARATHGLWQTRIYNIYYGMKDRCENSRSKDYPQYGGRGIHVCLRWKKSVKNFFSDMGHPPSLDYSIDRKNNNKGYSKANCRWATRSQQQQNKRDKYE